MCISLLLLRSGNCNTSWWPLKGDLGLEAENASVLALGFFAFPAYQSLTGR